MADTPTDLAALTLRVKALAGDIDHHIERTVDDFKEVRSSLEQLGGRIDRLTQQMELLRGSLGTLSVTRKISQRFTAALDGSWVRGTTSRQTTLSAGAEENVAIGHMVVVLPQLSRIQAFRASLRLLNINALPFGHELTISLRRVDARDNVEDLLGTFAREPVFDPLRNPLPRPDLRTELRREAIPGRDLVDNDLFAHLVLATYNVKNADGQSVVVPEGMVVLDAFEVDCIAA